MSRRAFTITELLVTIAILALLMGLLIPVIAGVSASGRSAACQSNLRQMSVAVSAYVSIYSAYPAALRYDNDGGVFTTVAWDFAQSGFGASAMITPGPLWQFTDHPDHVQQCPDFHGQSTFMADPFTGYNYNTTFIGAEATFPTAGWEGIRRGVPIGQHRRTETTAVFGDGGWSGGANKFMRAPMNSVEQSLSTVYAGGQAFRHRGWTNVAYLDGHVSSVDGPCRGAHATDALLSGTMSYPHNGFLSDDDSAYDPR